MKHERQQSQEIKAFIQAKGLIHTSFFIPKSVITAKSILITTKKAILGLLSGYAEK